MRGSTNELRVRSSVRLLERWKNFVVPQIDRFENAGPRNTPIVISRTMAGGKLKKIPEPANALFWSAGDNQPVDGVVRFIPPQLDALNQLAIHRPSFPHALNGGSTQHRRIRTWTPDKNIRGDGIGSFA